MESLLPLPSELCQLIDQFITTSHLQKHQLALFTFIHFEMINAVEEYKPDRSYAFAGRERLVKVGEYNWLWHSAQLNHRPVTGDDMYIPIQSIDQDRLQGVNPFNFHAR
jgi:hypothetical protein